MGSEVLVCGNDLLLLRTRKAVLRSAHLDSSYVEGLKDLPSLLAGNGPRLLILCHSLNSDEISQGIALAQSQSPQTKILVLAGSSGEQVPKGCYELDAFSGPHSLIRKAEELLGSGSQAKA